MSRPKSIFLVYRGDEEEGAAFDTAVHLALQHNAHLECWDITPDPTDIYVPSMARGRTLVLADSLIEQVKSEARERAQKIQAKIADISEKTGLHNISLHSVLGNVSHTISKHGRISDLIVIGRTARNTSYPSIINTALFFCGRPVLVTPPGERREHFGQTAVIAWNGSSEAMRAVSSSLPYLASGKVWILSQDKQHIKDAVLLENGLADYLERHGILASTLTPETGDALPKSILAAAKKVDADMIVMGAWGHSRITEFVLGGVTAYMLESSDIPVLLEH